MKTIILSILILLVFINSAVCNNTTTNIYTDEISPEIIGGDNLIVPYYQFNDSYFSVKNDGYLSYTIYMYNYIGNSKDYTDSFIGVLNSDQIITLNSNASYKFYASYDKIQDFTDIEKVKDKFNMWWIYIFIGVILFSIIILGIKKVLRI